MEQMIAMGQLAGLFFTVIVPIAALGGLVLYLVHTKVSK
jgi:hypothetical protein